MSKPKLTEELINVWETLFLDEQFYALVDEPLSEFQCLTLKQICHYARIGLEAENDRGKPGELSWEEACE